MGKGGGVRGRGQRVGFLLKIEGGGISRAGGGGGRRRWDVCGDRGGGKFLDFQRVSEV